MQLKGIIGAILYLVVMQLELCMSEQLPHNIIAVSGHKTGTVMLSSIFHEVARKYGAMFTLLHEWNPSMRKSYRIYHTWKFTDIIKYAPYIGSYKAIIITRHPLDIFISAQRYHKIASEEWLYQPRSFLNGTTYQQYMNSISESAGIITELTCSPTVHDMISTISAMKYNKNVSVYPIHKFRLNFEYVCRHITNHLELSHGIVLRAARKFSYDKFVHTKHSSLDPSTALGRKTQLFEFLSQLNCLHYNHYEAIYGLQSLCVTGYCETVDLFVTKQREVCNEKPEDSAAYVKRNCECYDSSGFIHAFSGCRYKEPSNFYYNSTLPVVNV